VEGDDEEDDENEEEEEEEEEEDEASPPKKAKKAESPPAKKAKKAESPPAKKAKTTNTAAVLSADILAEAKTKGLDLKLKAMMQVPQVLEKKIGAGAALKALENADGKAVVAKKALLGA